MVCNIHPVVSYSNPPRSAERDEFCFIDTQNSSSWSWFDGSQRGRYKAIPGVGLLWLFGALTCWDIYFSVVFVHGLGGHPQRTWSTAASLAPASAEFVPSKLSVLNRKTRSKIKNFVRKKSPEPGSSTTEGSTNSPADEEETSIFVGAVEARGTTTEDPADQPSVPSRIVFWPRDLLAKDFENVRILTFGYGSDPTGSSQNNLFSLSKNLVVKLANERLEKVRTSIEENWHHMERSLIGNSPTDRSYLFVTTWAE